MNRLSQLILQTRNGLLLKWLHIWGFVYYPSRPWAKEGYPRQKVKSKVKEMFSSTWRANIATSVNSPNMHPQTIWTCEHLDTMITSVSDSTLVCHQVSSQLGFGCKRPLTSVTAVRSFPRVCACVFQQMESPQETFGAYRTNMFLPTKWNLLTHAGAHCTW